MKTNNNSKHFLKPPPENGVLRSGQIREIEAQREGGPGPRWRVGLLPHMSDNGLALSPPAAGPEPGPPLQSLPPQDSPLQSLAVGAGPGGLGVPRPPGPSSRQPPGLGAVGGAGTAQSPRLVGAAGAPAGLGRHAALCPGLGPGPQVARPVCGHLHGPASVRPARSDAGRLAAVTADLEAVPEGPSSLQPWRAAQQGGRAGRHEGRPGALGLAPCPSTHPLQALLDSRVVPELWALQRRLYWWVETTTALTWHLAYLITWTTCLASHLLQAAFEHTAQLAQSQDAEPPRGSGTLSASPLPEPLGPEAGPALPEHGTPAE